MNLVSLLIYIIIAQAEWDGESYHPPPPPPPPPPPDEPPPPPPELEDELDEEPLEDEMSLLTEWLKLLKVVVET